MHLCGKMLAVHITNNDEEQGRRGTGGVSPSETLSLVKRKQRGASAQMLSGWKEICLQACLNLFYFFKPLLQFTVVSVHYLQAW